MTIRNALKKIVVVGGGMAGWGAAACLIQNLRHTPCEVILVESPDVPIIGVGEATIPSFIDFLEYLDISKTDFIKKTNSTFKLGIRFVDWLRKGHSYWHQFGNVGPSIDHQPFYQHWLKAHIAGQKSTYTEYSPAIAMAKKDKFYIASKSQNSIFSNSTYALHFDASLAAKYLSMHAISLGVTHILGHVSNVNLTDAGNIESVSLRGVNESLKADFFVDCSGQSSLLLGQALGVEYEDWSHYLPVDRAIVTQAETVGPISPYTEASAQPYGWSWKIPLHNRTGHGYIYSSKFCSDEIAEEELRSSISSKLITDPRHLIFRTGKRKQFWTKNCLALGLSSGFLEPLESTSIYLSMRGILAFMKLLPGLNSGDQTCAEYNRLMEQEYQDIRDFIILHYCKTERKDSSFWRSWQKRPLPESLTDKLQLFQEYGYLRDSPKDLFSHESWYAVLEGMGVRPDHYSWIIDGSNANEVSEAMTSYLELLSRTVARLPSHNEFVDKIRSRQIT